MSSELKRTINRQLLELDRINGAIALSVDVMKAFSSTLKSYEGDMSQQALIKEFIRLHDLFMSCRPRMAQVILDTQRGLLHLMENSTPDLPKIQGLIENNIQQKWDNADKIVELSAELLDNDKILFLHSYSTQIDRLITFLANKNIKPRVIVAEQEEVKTARLLRVLDKYEFNFHVVSEYSVSHIIDSIDVAMFGALTINHNRGIVMAPGSSGLVSDMNRSSIPVYALLPTGKFSYWEDNYEPAYMERRDKQKYGVEYKKDVYSHDVLDLKLFTATITEEGILDYDNLIALFIKLQKEFLIAEEKIDTLKARNSNG
ncbi:MAG: hypothetical protein R3A13_08285 [Bdellovibrionota bacterium]